jgi:uncharacterized membrane protein YgcG
MEYPDVAIKALINCLDDDQQAYEWLSKSKWKELAALSDYLSSGDEKALGYLLQNKEKFDTIVNFLAALQKEEKAFNLLMAKEDKEWAAVVASVHGSEEAYQWLIKNGFVIYAALAEILIQKLNSGSGSVHGFVGGSGGGSAGDGFGGFGGGSFGGAGSGGTW